MEELLPPRILSGNPFVQDCMISWFRGDGSILKGCCSYDDQENCEGQGF